MSELTMGQRIADGRKKLGLSQEALGERMGVSRQAISKWEADGAVPEIDKLIALSKLFGVTVGWLLGVEDAQEQQSADAFTDEQLKLLEQIVRSYQPPQAPAIPEEQPKPRRWIRVIAAVLAMIVLLSVWSELNQQINNTSHQISGLHSGYSSILSQLGLLAERLDAIAEGEKLVSEITFDAVAWEDQQGADAVFRGVPKSWRAGDSAYLSVRVGGEEIRQFPCVWDGSSCQTQLSLEAANGYTVYFVIVHADGTQEQQLLKRTGLEELANDLAVCCQVTVEPEIENNFIVFDYFSLRVSVPRIRKENEQPRLVSLDWVLAVNGEEVSREAVLMHMHDDLVDNIQVGSNGLQRFSIPSPAVGDQIVLYVEAVVSDGTRITDTAAEFFLTESGWTQS